MYLYNIIFRAFDIFINIVDIYETSNKINKGTNLKLPIYCLFTRLKSIYARSADTDMVRRRAMDGVDGVKHTRNYATTVRV